MEMEIKMSQSHFGYKRIKTLCFRCNKRCTIEQELKKTPLKLIVRRLFRAIWSQQ